MYLRARKKNVVAAVDSRRTFYGWVMQWSALRLADGVTLRPIFARCFATAKVRRGTTLRELTVGLALASTFSVVGFTPQLKPHCQIRCYSTPSAQTATPLLLLIYEQFIQQPAPPQDSPLTLHRAQQLNTSQHPHDMHCSSQGITL